MTKDWQDYSITPPGADILGRQILLPASQPRSVPLPQRWRSVVMSERYLSRQKDIAVLAYRVSAERSDEPIYKALCTSTYLSDDGKWLRLAHQQTPVGNAHEDRA